MYRALVVGAYGDGGACAFSVDDDRGLGCFARKHWLCIGVFDSILNLAEVPALHGSGPLLSCVPPAVLDLDNLGTGCNLAVDVRRELDLIAGSVETLCGIRATGKYFPLARHRESRRRREEVELNLPQSSF